MIDCQLIYFYIFLINLIKANKNRPQEITESDNYLLAVRSCFRHIALDYVKSLTTLQSRKKPEILATVCVFKMVYYVLDF